MRISLDYDHTFTAAPAMFRAFVALARAHGHEVICVTMRHPHETITDLDVPIIYTGRRAKWDFCREMGVEIDIWIDDAPGWILNDAA